MAITMEYPVRAFSRQQIDKALAEMATDDAYRKEAVAIALEFEDSDWVAISTGLRGPPA